MTSATGTSPAIKRRHFLMTSVAMAITPWAASAKTTELTIWKSPTCGCCRKWATHMKQAGFSVTINDVGQTELEATKDRFAVPANLRSCHTAMIGGYVVEGHVPASDVRLLLSHAPRIAGLAVPGMPIGSPGMEMGEEIEPYASYAFDHNGDIQVFARHGSTE